MISISEYQLNRLLTSHDKPASLLWHGWAAHMQLAMGHQLTYPVPVYRWHAYILHLVPSRVHHSVRLHTLHLHQTASQPASTLRHDDITPHHITHHKHPHTKAITRHTGK